MPSTNSAETEAIIVMSPIKREGDTTFSSSSAATPTRHKAAPSTPRKQTGASSPFFTPTSTKRLRPSPGKISSLKAPPLSEPNFGLIQEEFADDPFKLIIAVIFLNRTRGFMAIPLFRQLIGKFPTPSNMAYADEADVAAIKQPLGLHNQRAATLISIAKAWLTHPPTKGQRFKTASYPSSEASKNIKSGEVLSDDDIREAALEIGHIPGLGPYAWDSWRIFCRDKLRGLADSWNGEGAGGDFEPEWKRVLPKDKELRAFLRWMWLKEGWKWDPETGELEVASEELIRQGQAGGLKWEGDVF